MPAPTNQIPAIFVEGDYSRATVYAEELDAASSQQLLDFCNCKAFEGSNIVVMPDVHSGNGCVVGMAADVQHVIPSLIGPDIGCGMHTVLFVTKEPIDFEKLDEHIRINIPSGFHMRGGFNIPCKYQRYRIQIADKIAEGAYTLQDLMIENVQKYLTALGTLGGGNHFIEIGELYQDPTFTQPQSLYDMDDEGWEDYHKYIMVIHSGSRGLGMQVYRHYNEMAKQQTKDEVPNGLYYLDGRSTNASYYLADHRDTITFAKLNRQIMSAIILDCVDGYEVANWTNGHNIITDNNISYVHRKGCCYVTDHNTLAIPLNMRDGIVLCEYSHSIGSRYSQILHTIPHGAGRKLSRSEAKSTLSMEDFKESMKDVYTSCVNEKTLDEAPMAYKDSSLIINYLNRWTRIKGYVKPLYNFKG